MEWNLFNPYPEFNLKNMSKKLDISSLDNPNIQVIWEDTAENFTQEKIKSVKQYFYKKYNSTNVNVITKVKTTDETQQTVDVSVNIMDKNYQRELIKSLLESKGQEKYFDQLMNIDLAVENRISAEDVEVSPFKRWYIKKIEFSNFLSYGENQVIDFEKCNGITVVESDPPNFGGKTVLTVDLLLFLFFNTTTKTQKAEEIFNRFTDKNAVSVRGEILIDGEEYIIARKIERKKAKSGEWNVKTELDFFKKLSDGQLQNFTGEQRRETEDFIKKSIGNMEDFLMTIVTTASNLEDLLEAKPTARGQVLSRFLGLEFLKKKEEFGKEIYSEFSKGMLSNVYNTESLKNDNQNSEEEIIECNSSIADAQTKIKDVDNRLKKGQDYKDNLLKSKFTDLDQDLVILNPDRLQIQIEEHKTISSRLKSQIQEIKIVEPKKFYHEDQHDSVREKIKSTNGELILAENKVEEIEDLIKKYGDGIQCEHCGIKLMEAELTKKKIEQLEKYKKLVKEFKKELEGLEKKEQSFTQLKKDKEKRDYEKVQTTNQNQITFLKERIEKNNELILKIAEEYEKEKVYKIYLDIFGKNGISKIIMKTMMPLINQELQRLLIDSCYFNLEIRINEKNEVEFVMIDNSTGIEKLMVSGSGYERTIAAMALRAVLSKVCSLPKPNVIVWDEVFGKISNDNLDMVGEFFQKMREYFEKIFVISHNPLINAWGNNTLKISKSDNVSRVIQ